MDTQETVAERIAANVRRAAADRQMSKMALSKATGIPYSTLKARMSGKRSAFTATDIIAIGEVLDVDTAELMAVERIAS